MRSSADMIVTRGERETEALGRDIAQRCGVRGAIWLFGDLGAGKTAFVRGLVEGYGGSADDVSSPTFTVMQEYAALETTVRHVDLYRITSAFDVDELTLDDFARDGVVCVEWAERFNRSSDDVWTVRFAIVDEMTRHITVAPPRG